MDHKTYKRYLIENKESFHTHPTAETKTHAFVLRELHGDTQLEQI